MLIQAKIHGTTVYERKVDEVTPYFIHLTKIEATWRVARRFKNDIIIEVKGDV